MILIITNESDVHADRMEQILADRERHCVRFDSASFPVESSLSVAFDADGLRSRRLCHPSGPVELGDVEAVWFRRPGRPQPAPDLAGSPAGVLCVQESATAMEDVWETLDVPCLPGPRPVVLRAQYKVRQLQLATRLGFEIPPTLITTDPSKFLDFFSLHGGRVITKQVGVTELPRTADGDVVGRYTELVRRADLRSARTLRYCPVIAQAYVPKRLEVRATVVGGIILAAAINSQAANHTRHDWRRYDEAQTVMVPYDLPPDVAASCIALVKALGLCYGAIDLVLTPDGRHVFLEINPSGQYLWVEDATGLPITAAIADLLCGVAPQPPHAEPRPSPRSPS